MTKREKLDIKRAIATQNKRLAKLEQKGLEKASSAYRYLEAQYEAGSNYLYKDKRGNIRFRSNISKMSADKISQIKHEVSSFRQAQTSTVKGTKRFKSNLETGYNKMLSDLGIDKKVSAKQIKETHDSAIYKALFAMYGSGQAVKVYYSALDKKSLPLLDHFITGKITEQNKIDPDSLIKLFDTHKEYESATRGLLTRKQVQDILYDTAAFDLYTPAEFRKLVERVKKHLERGENLSDKVRDTLNDGFM